MKQNLFSKINLGIGDALFYRSFIDPIKDGYEHIYITHATDALAFWFNNDQERLKFNTQLAELVFNVPPYKFVLNANYPFYPNERIARELNNKPVTPNLDHLCKGKSIDTNKYIVITTKVREFHLSLFEEIKLNLSKSLNDLSNKYSIVILGEREVQKTKEYTNSVNKDKVFGIYDFLINSIPNNKIVDLTIPALGIKAPEINQFRQDCLIVKEADAVITLGIGGNFWLSNCLAKNHIGLRGDIEWTTDLLDSKFLTKDINQFSNYLERL